MVFLIHFANPLLISWLSCKAYSIVRHYFLVKNIYLIFYLIVKWLNLHLFLKTTGAVPLLLILGLLSDPKILPAILFFKPRYSFEDFTLNFLFLYKISFIENKFANIFMISIFLKLAVFIWKIFSDSSLIITSNSFIRILNTKNKSEKI